MLKRFFSALHNVPLPTNKTMIPTYSRSSALLDEEHATGQILFKPKDEYVPRDLNAKNVESIIAKRRHAKTDVLEELCIDPLEGYKNVRMLSHFVTELGFIKPRSETGLSCKNQKKMAKAIRRARSMGIHY